jgi:glycosyltransferase involved in cell wall biosynthesis
VIPTYNYGRFLARAVTSVLEQTCPVLEIIVVDDGSTDNTREVASSFGDRIRYIWQENRGLCAARNRGIAEARGEWIGLLDSDDWWFPQKNQKVQDLLSVHPDAVMIYHPSLMVRSDGHQSLWEVLEPDSLWPTMRHENSISGGSSVVMRRAVILKLGGFDVAPTRAEALDAVADWDMWVRVALEYPLHKIPEPLTGMWTHAGSMSANPVTMAEAIRRLADKTLTRGLHGIERLLFRQRFLAYRAFDASVELRPRDRAAARHYLMRSLVDWPSPFYLPKRWWALCLTLAGRL